MMWTRQYDLAEAPQRLMEWRTFHDLKHAPQVGLGMRVLLTLSRFPVGPAAIHR